MFIITLTYVVDLDEVDEALPAHVRWLDEQYADGVLLLSGGRVPRTGGVLIAAGIPRDELERRLDGDPFRHRGLARYEVAEFSPTRSSPALASLLSA